MESRLEEQQAGILEQGRNLAQEADGHGAVNDPMIVRQAERQHQALDDVAVFVTEEALLRPGQAENGDLGRIDDGRERGAADAPRAHGTAIRFRWKSDPRACKPVR